MVSAEDSFECSKCGAVTKSSDFSFKDQNLYQALKTQGECENCAKGETSPSTPSPQQMFEQYFTMLDCIVKHDWTSHVLLLEGIEAAIKKGLPYETIQALVKIHDQHVEASMLTLSFLMPDKECLPKIQELLRAVGWMNACEEHMGEKFSELSATPLSPKLLKFIDNLPMLMKLRRDIRRQLESELFKSMIEPQPQVALLGAADSKE